jgi:ankyrin repeat protein
MRAKLINENIDDLFVPKSEEDIIKELSKLSQEEKNEKLFNAVEKDQLDIVKLIVKAGADINAKNYANDTVLIWASAHDKLEVVKYLIKMGADINIKNKFGNTSLKYAIRNNKIEILTYLIENGADINTKNDALTYAYKFGYVDRINLLKKYGAK